MKNFWQIKYGIVLLAAKFLVLTTTKPSMAFGFYYPPFYEIRPYDIYSYVDDQTGERIAGVTTLRLVDDNLKLGGSDELWALLNAFSSENPGNWEFVRADNELKGSIETDFYKACGQGTQCGGQGNNGVGADISLYFAPAGDDPIPDVVSSDNKLRWIQRVESNHSLNPDVHGLPENVLDEDFESNRRSPYYYDRGRRTSKPGIGGVLPFDDTPYRIDANHSHQWTAELYLAEIIAKEGGKEKVKIYNGIKWGWINTVARLSKTFFGTLASGYQTDTYKLDQLTPGSKYTAWTNNDLPSNRCNPNTGLTASSPDGSFAFDDNSSPLGNGFASGLTGTVGASGTINLNVGSTGGGARGQDKGNYELFVDVYEPNSPTFSIGSSGGGGFGKEMRGLTQQNPILPTSVQNGWQTFSKVPGCRWYDPYTTYGFEFQSLEDTLFTEILDFPVGEDTEFAVTVGNVLLGTFGPGSSIDFVSLLGHGISNFKITGINSLFGSTAETAFPIQLAFNSREGSFKMRAISADDAENVPEPTTVLGTLLAVGGLGIIKKLKNRKNKE